MKIMSELEKILEVIVDMGRWCEGMGGCCPP